METIDTEKVSEIRTQTADAIRTFCQSLGAGSVTISSDGIERIYHSGISLDALSAAVAIKLRSLASVPAQHQAKGADAPPGAFWQDGMRADAHLARGDDYLEQVARTLARTDSLEMILATSDASELHHVSDKGWRDWLPHAKALVADGHVGAVAQGATPKCPTCAGAGAVNGTDCADCYGGGEVVGADGLPVALAERAPADDLEDLVARFAKALLAKLKLARANDRSGWERNDWEERCQQGLLGHIEKGDPRDVAAYCAFLWHHGWSTKAAPKSAEQESYYFSPVHGD